MAKNYIGEGERIVVTTSTAVTSGDLLMVNDLAAVALHDAAGEEKVACQAVGIFRLAHKANEAITQGTKVYWDADGDPLDGEAGSGCLTATATDNKYVGICWADAAQADQTIEVKINA